jgi:Tfp pilus assembly protein PilO
VFGLEKKPLWFNAAAGAVAGLALFGLLFWQITQKRQQPRIDAAKARLAELQVQINEGRAAEQKLPQFREEVQRLTVELDKLLRILPSRRNTPDLLRRIRTLTEQGDFDLKSFQPGAYVEKDFYSEWPISVTLDGTYHNLAFFFDRISRFSRIINVENLQLSALRQGTREHTLAASFVAKTFIYKEPSPPAPAGEGTQ